MIEDGYKTLQKILGNTTKNTSKYCKILQNTTTILQKYWAILQNTRIIHTTVILGNTT